MKRASTMSKPHFRKELTRDKNPLHPLLTMATRSLCNHLSLAPASEKDYEAYDPRPLHDQHTSSVKVPKSPGVAAPLSLGLAGTLIGGSFPTPPPK